MASKITKTIRPLIAIALATTAGVALLWPKPKDTEKNQPLTPGQVIPMTAAQIAKIEAANPGANIIKISPQDIQSIRIALMTALSEAFFVANHAEIAKARGFNQFEMEDSRSRADIQLSLDFLTEFAREKGLGDKDGRAIVAIDTENNSVLTSVNLYKEILKQLQKEQKALKAEQNSDRPR